MTIRYIHSVDTALVMAADNIAGYIQGLLDGAKPKHTAYALDRESRQTSLVHFLGKQSRMTGIVTAKAVTQPTHDRDDGQFLIFVRNVVMTAPAVMKPFHDRKRGQSQPCLLVPILD